MELKDHVGAQHHARQVRAARPREIRRRREPHDAELCVANASGVSSMVNTGSSSPGELEMTRSTSEVAVCCSNAAESLARCAAAPHRQPHVWIAMTAWRRRSRQLDLRIGGGFTSWRKSPSRR